MLSMTRPTEEQALMFAAISRELKRRAASSLTDDERAIIAARFVDNYDFSNAAIAHKSPRGWAQLIISEIED